MKKIFVAIAAIALLVLTGCSTASTKSDEVALHYNGGGTASKTFADCVPSAKHVTNGPGDKYYYYPQGQRTFSFTDANANDEKQDPLPVTTRDGQTVNIPGFVTFELNTDCATLRDFHEKIGLKYGAYHDKDQDSSTPGWQNLLRDYIAVPLSSTMNNAAGNVATWGDLYTSDVERNKMEDVVKANLPAALKKTLGGDYIRVLNVSFSKPQARPELLSQIELREKNRLAKLAQDEANKTQATKYDGLVQCRKKGLTEQACLLIYLADGGKIPFYPLPTGGSINVQGAPAQGQPAQ